MHTLLLKNRLFYPLLFLLFLIGISIFAHDAEAKSKGFLQNIKNTLSDTWNSPTHELYIPANTWHNRAAYSRSKVDGYNERPWGIGYGVTRFDEDGDWHSLYIMEFQDSHNEIEPIGGYGYQTYWRLDDAGKWRIGIGYTLSITARHDYDWIPFPAPLPLLSFEYDRFSIQNTYVPGFHKNNGNVLFTWLRWRL
ncbi:lipid IV(A) palmitoyltransferase PagP [Orbaceae bacterium ESL0721]|nr:lipid IV(A) palmitoyltransferase PagP [Orbaceae bacterium ESL0721]